MKLAVSQLLGFLDEQKITYAYRGRKERYIEGFCALSNLKRECITWIKHLETYDVSGIDKNLDVLLVTNRPETVEVPEGYDVIQCANPKEVFFGILNCFWGETREPGIASTAVVETESIGKNVRIGHHCYIGADVTIGDDVTIDNNVTICCRTSIGDRTSIHSGVVIGTDGYGYYTDENGNNRKVPHYAGVTIGADVEIGANTCIDRGTLEDTVIGNNVKIDNLCHIAHNVQIGENSMVIALSLLGGSAQLMRNSYIAPGALVMNQVKCGEDSFVGMGAVVVRDVPDNKVVAGVPAKILRDNK